MKELGPFPQLRLTWLKGRLVGKTSPVSLCALPLSIANPKEQTHEGVLAKCILQLFAKHNQDHVEAVA